MIKQALISRYTAMRRPSSFRGIRPTGRNPARISIDEFSRDRFDRRLMARRWSRNDRNGGGAKQRGKNVLADEL